MCYLLYKSTWLHNEYTGTVNCLVVGFMFCQKNKFHMIGSNNWVQSSTKPTIKVVLQCHLIMSN